MEDRISIAGTGKDIASLRDWLAHEPELRGYTRFDRAAPRDGEMGAPLVLAIVVATAPIARAVERALTVWLASRHSETKIELTAVDGNRVSVTNAGRTRPEQLLAQIEAHLQRPPLPEPPAPEPSNASAD